MLDVGCWMLGVWCVVCLRHFVGLSDRGLRHRCKDFTQMHRLWFSFASFRLRPRVINCLIVELFIRGIAKYWYKLLGVERV